MGKGKVAAQCAHAALGCWKEAVRGTKQVLSQWEASGQMKIALKCDDEQSMIQIQKSALEKGLPIKMVKDAGRTQVPRGSLTVLAIIGTMHHKQAYCVRVTKGIRRPGKYDNGVNRPSQAAVASTRMVKCL
ncbi:hypothetical protein SpCBS45565_g03050 [Spizellomyces sp. 'palustris']|nr:hypothetical protein SpCBS45565_g03050 [Spizellomyces sp. 'palustris']